MKVVLTGSTGRIGGAVLGNTPRDAFVETLLDPLEQAVPNGLWFRADLANHGATVRGVTCASPDAVIHLAAMTDVDACEIDNETAFRINCDGTAHIAEACLKCGARLVYVSTDYVFDGRSGPYAEDDSPNPVNVYGASKLAGEEAARDIIGDLLVVRISVPFGVRRGNAQHNFVSWMIGELAAGESIRVVDDQFTTPAFIDELAELLWRFAGGTERGIVHYGTADRLSRYEMALELCRVMGFDESLVVPVKTVDMEFAAERPLESGFVTDRLHDIVGAPPVLYRNALYRIADDMA